MCCDISNVAASKTKWWFFFLRPICVFQENLGIGNATLQANRAKKIIGERSCPLGHWVSGRRDDDVDCWENDQIGVDAARCPIIQLDPGQRTRRSCAHRPDSACYATKCARCVCTRFAGRRLRILSRQLSLLYTTWNLANNIGCETAAQTGRSFSFIRFRRMKGGRHRTLSGLMGYVVRCWFVGVRPKATKG